jgi:hypothetical protein
MEPAKATMSDADLIDMVRKAAYVSCSHNDILAIEELIRRYKHAKIERASVTRVHQDDGVG